MTPSGSPADPLDNPEAEVWIRATPGGRVLDVAIDEGRGEVKVEWSIRRVNASKPPAIVGPFVQSPYRDPVPSDYTDAPIRMIPEVE